MKVVAIKQMSTGNDVAGETWQETKIFDGTKALRFVMDWAMSPDDRYSRKQITLTVPHGERFHVAKKD